MRLLTGAVLLFACATAGATSEPGERNARRADGLKHRERDRAGYRVGQFRIFTRLSEAQLPAAQWQQRAQQAERFLQAYQIGLGGLEPDGSPIKNRYFRHFEIRDDPGGLPFVWDPYGGTIREPKAVVSNAAVDWRAMLDDWNSGKAVGGGAAKLTPRQVRMLKASDTLPGLVLRLHPKIATARSWRDRWPLIDPAGRKKIAARTSLESMMDQIARAVPDIAQSVAKVVASIRDVRARLEHPDQRAAAVAAAHGILTEHFATADSATGFSAADMRVVEQAFKADQAAELSQRLDQVVDFLQQQQNQTAAAKGAIVKAATVYAGVRGDTEITDVALLKVGSPLVMDMVYVDAGDAPTRSSAGQSMEQFVAMRSGKLKIRRWAFLSIGSPTTLDEILVNTAVLSNIEGITRALVRAAVADTFLKRPLARPEVD